MKELITSALSEIIQSLGYPADTEIIIQQPKNPQHGDFSTNLAMQLAGRIGKSPMEIAESLRQKLEADYSKLIESVEIAGPGFINLHMNKNQLTSQLHDIIKSDKDFGRSDLGKGKKAQVEFVSANPTGPLTVGHGRGAMLGDVVSSILEWNGYNVQREYYFNNAGRQMRRLGESVQARYLELLGEEGLFPEGGYEGEYIYDIAKSLQDRKGDAFKNEKDIAVFKDEAETRIFSEIKETLKNIGLKFDSFFNEKSLYESGAIESVLNALKKRNLVYEKEGATWFKASALGREQDRVLIKSTGEPTYRLPDIAYHLDKFNRGFDLMVDVLGADHMESFPDVLAAIGQLDCEPEKVKVLIHQFVTLTQGGEPVKMSTRKANFVTLNELIDEVGADVVRYFFIMRGMNTHLNFDMELARDESDENPVFYLQYAHARLCNILKHADSMGHKLNLEADLSLLNHELEVQLIQRLMAFPDIIRKAHDSLEPQSIAIYLQETAAVFHRYYAQERVVNENNEKTAARLILMKGALIVLGNGLNILGINAPERM